MYGKLLFLVTDLHLHAEQQTRKVEVLNAYANIYLFSTLPYHCTLALHPGIQCCAMT